MATKTAKKINKQFDLNKGIKAVKGTAKNVNAFALETSNEVIDASIATASVWQGVAEKAIKGGFKLVRKQQDITFDTLESVKGQLVDGRKRFAKLLNKK